MMFPLRFGELFEVPISLEAEWWQLVKKRAACR